MSKYNYDQQKWKKKIAVLKLPGAGNKAFIAIDSLPEKYYNLMLETFGDPEQYYQESQAMAAKSIPDIYAPFFKKLDESYFQTKYNVNGGRANGRNRANELAIGCAIFRLLNAYSTKKRIQEHTGYDSKAELKEAIFDYVKSYGKGEFDGGLYEMPSSYRRFQPKYNDFMDAMRDSGRDERDVFKPKGHGNDNGLKFTHEHRTVFLETYLDPTKPDKLNCYLDYKAIMQTVYDMTEEQVISYTRFKQITLEKDIKTLAAKCRHGGPYYEVFVRPWIIRKAPQYSMSLVAGDGWMPGRTISYDRMVKDEKGILHKKHFERAMNVWVWYDWKSKCILNHYISGKEKSEAIRKSFRDIINVHGGCPLSVMMDKKWTKNPDMARMFEVADVMIQHKRAYNPKSLIAERNFKELNKHHRDLDPMWVDVTNNTLEFKHNEEWVRGAKPLPEAEFRAMILEIIQRHNHTALASLDGKTPWQVFDENRNPDVKVFDPLELAYAFGGRRNPKVKNYRFDIQIASKSYDYYIAEEDMLDYMEKSRADDKVIAYYDEIDMETVYLYAYDGKGTDAINDQSTHRYICAAYYTDEIAINASAAEEALDHKFAKQQRRGQLLDDWIDETLQEHVDEMEAIGLTKETVMTASQERYKEVHSNRIGQAYGQHINQRDSDEGYPVKIEKPEAALSLKDKERLLEERMNKL